MLLQQPHRLRTLSGCLVPSRSRVVVLLYCAAFVLQRPLVAAVAPPVMPRMTARCQASREARRCCPAGAAAEQALSRLPPSVCIDSQHEPLLHACFCLGQAHRANTSRTAAPRQSEQLEPSCGRCRSLPRFALQRMCVLCSAAPSTSKRDNAQAVPSSLSQREYLRGPSLHFLSAPCCILSADESPAHPSVLATAARRGLLGSLPPLPSVQVVEYHRTPALLPEPPEPPPRHHPFIRASLGHLVAGQVR
jgi:hypothetical protein